MREARSVSLLAHCWPDIKAHSGKLRQSVRFVPEADIACIMGGQFARKSIIDFSPFKNFLCHK